MEFEHELALTQFKLALKNLPPSLQGSIGVFKRRKLAMEAKKPYSRSEELKLQVYSASIADDIISFYEKDKPAASAIASAKAEKATKTEDELKKERIAKYQANRDMRNK